MSKLARAGQVILVLLGLLSMVIAASVYAPSDEPFEPDAQALIATFGVGFGLLVVVLAVFGLGRGHRWAWQALWVVPFFMVSHVLLLGTWLPDGVFAVLSTVALLVSQPREVRYQSPPRSSDVTASL